MLENLRIQNIALIDKLDINFAAGLNILTGETGAGKSILFDSINFVLGERAGKELIRTGCDFCEVEALVSINPGNKSTIAALTEFGINLDDDYAVLLHRNLTSAGKNICKVNGRIVTVGMLKDVSTLLIDIHGQHSHQSLLAQNKHVELLDRLCPAELQTSLASLASHLKTRRELIRQIKDVTEAGGGDIEKLNEQIREIEKANLKPGEEEQLNERKTIAQNAKRLSTAAEAASRLVLSDGGSLDSLISAIPQFEKLAETDPSFQPLYDRFYAICDQLRDACHDAAPFLERAEKAENVDSIEERLDLIYKLKRKYAKGASSVIDDVLATLDKTRSKVEYIKNSAELLAALNEKRKQLEREIAADCALASKIRKAAAVQIQTQITDALKELGMQNALFEISIERKNEFGLQGFDMVEFMITPNRGQPLMPLSKIASGGEMSRVMLALKTVLANADNIETFIFDEIDTGVSGRTALKVAEALRTLSTTHQLLCITHLPQIAAAANTHYQITKTSDVEATYTTVSPLTREERIHELARLIGGAIITETTLKSAEEMMTIR